MWSWKSFSELTTAELYQVIRLRERVFVVEQNCVYVDCDEFDLMAWHLTKWKDGSPTAYMRVFAPGVKYPEASFGRVLTAPESRKLGLGRDLVREGLSRIETNFGKVPIRISSQSYLTKFYQEFGFEIVGLEYLEDGIPHSEMKRSI